VENTEKLALSAGKCGRTCAKRCKLVLRALLGKLLGVLGSSPSCPRVSTFIHGGFPPFLG